MNKEEVKRHSEFKDSILQFYRNGRWGTCIGCPEDSEGKKYPEFCPNTNRYDHHLSMYDLSASYQLRVKENLI